MFDPFEIIDPVERFVEASAQAVAPGSVTAEDRRTRINRAVFLAGTAVLAICALIFANIVGPKLGRDPVSQGNAQSDFTTSSLPRVSSTRSDGDPKVQLPASSPPVQAIHAIDPEAKPAQGSAVQPQASQNPASLPAAPIGQGAESNGAPADLVTPDEQPQWVKTSLAAKAHSEPSVSAPILKYYPVGTELRVTGRQNGWIQVADPTTSEQGWIYEVYLAPSVGVGKTQDAPPQQQPPSDTGPLSTEAALDAPDENETSIPAPPAPVTRERRHFHARPALVIRLRLPRFW